MKYWYQKPHPSIAEYVKSILVLEDFSVYDAFTMPLFPNGMPTLLFQTKKGTIGNSTSGYLTLFGQTVFPENWTVKDNFTLIAYFFKPYALGTIFDLGAKELTDKPIDLKLWQYAKIASFEGQLLNTTTTKERLDLLDGFILEQIQKNRSVCQTIKYATDIIMLYPKVDALPAILKKLNVSQKTFQRMFKKHVGIMPNQYRRICQFHTAFEQLRSNDFKKLSDIAFDNGYTDQSHYIRAFKEFTHITPSDYIKNGLG
ncbi:helix-turn-helix domain-containing protein [Tenacibaculum singaporense]|uniref:helix-turn-helix domain-containing protein n=1 Tax=Tenacibaculum singaporense TaxID=2358479 RepID=UPI000F672991|nr:helix-turn-helix domain-containing protein [Tenacibaculum singaporense]RSC93486.1 AraC family transcriptional regulator [Tenacibaculum singaporense]